MKLSDLETLVKAMRKRADEHGVANPNVEFYDWSADRQDNYDISGELHTVLSQHTVVSDGSAAKRGDYSIPLRRC